MEVRYLYRKHLKVSLSIYREIYNICIQTLCPNMKGSVKKPALSRTIISICKACRHYSEPKLSAVKS
jgi:hypothetical protein